MIPLLRRLVGLLSIVCIALVLIAVSGGVGYSTRTVFRITDALDDDLRVYVQDSAVTNWGNPGVVHYSVYGAPYTVYLSGHLPLDSSHSEALIKGATVAGDGSLIAQVSGIPLDIGPVAVHRVDSVTKALGFGPESVATFDVLPNEVVVSGALTLSGASKTIEKPFVKRFPVFKVNEFQLGPWRWERTAPPNPSIERTSPGKPGAASHVKR